MELLKKKWLLLFAVLMLSLNGLLSYKIFSLKNSHVQHINEIETKIKLKTSNQLEVYRANFNITHLNNDSYLKNVILKDSRSA